MSEPDVPPLRDFFAALAMQAYIAEVPRLCDLSYVPTMAYRMADLMLKARD